ncbi:rCG59470, isoform CRA_c [Rattus norvegicus]|uniref:RCG59470, isoform CRA_c n=1 Tax=Rattus norvegicus TaxID=10116 RepID=A6HRI3_RAT|nr:rCG59470, isoform CRA_c [Rattus norvegicus]
MNWARGADESNPLRGPSPLSHVPNPVRGPSPLSHVPRAAASIVHRRILPLTNLLTCQSLVTKSWLTHGPWPSLAGL